MDGHSIHIKRCFELAKKALGQTSPNPYVGCVIVKEGQVIAEGYHKKAGLDHAEADAFKNATQDVKGATLYCNLEPCCHTNKQTPPCTDAIIHSGVAKVVISNLDPNPEVAGHGVQILRDAGIEVITGILEEEGSLLNEVFFTQITEKKPFVHLKWAQTLDGKIATLSHQSKWITNELSRAHVHKERDLYDAILVGDQTIIKDNPSLTIRSENKIKSKYRVILNPMVKLSNEYKILSDSFKEKTILVNTDKYQDHVQTLEVSEEKGQFNLEEVLSKLYQLGICSLYVEGGMYTLSQFFDQHIYDRVSIYIAPKLLGPGVSLCTREKLQLSDAIEFDQGHYTQFGNNILFESKRNICLQD